MTTNAINWLAERWAKSGIRKGDIVLLHSNIMRTLALIKREGYKPSADIVLESFLTAVGDEGTLLIPLFNFDFTSGTDFDIRSTPSHMGALTEIARKHPQAVRTGHPIYSFCAIGKESERFNNVDNYSGYAEDSPFGILKQLNGKIAVLDIEENQSMTFHHHVEEVMAVPYRYNKDFTGSYTDQSGQTSTKTYAIYVRDLEKNVVTYLNPIGEKLWNAGIYQGDAPLKKSGLRTCNANEVFEFVKQLILNDDALGNLYIISE